MHRFRKKSDTKRSTVPEQLRSPPPQEALPPLPPTSDFRTSLILPDLTRRFSVLRNSSGTPIALDDLRNKFAQQRARGSQNQVSEEEEDMILEALGRFHVKSARPRTADTDGQSQSHGTEGDDGGSRLSASPSLAGQQSVKSNATTASSAGGLHGSSSAASLSSAKGSQMSRRMSNNLFGSGKFRDHTYLRTANHRRGGGDRDSAVRSPPAVAESDSTTSMSTITSSRAGGRNNAASTYSTDNQSLRPVTPEGSSYASTTSNSVPSSPNFDLSPEKDGDADEASSLGLRMSKALSREGLRRASLALEQVITELEEEGDDEIVMERSPISRAQSTANRHPISGQLHESSSESTSTLPSPSGEYEGGTAVSSDDHDHPDPALRASPYPHSRTTSPAPRLPGYIPGMPRPMTPRDASAGVDSDDQMTPSATPRATSPRLPSLGLGLGIGIGGGGGSASPSTIAQSLASSLYRSGSAASTSRSSPAASTQSTSTSTPPLFFTRSTNGRFTPTSEDRTGTGNGNGRTASPSPAPDVLDSPVLGRRRPISPLSGPAFQPLANIAIGSSRPMTPSSITWTTAGNGSGNGNKPSPSSPAGGGRSDGGHSRNGSAASGSVSVSGSEGQGHVDGGGPVLDRARSLRSPALPDSPWVEGASANASANSSASASARGDDMSPHRPMSDMSAVDLGSPISFVNRLLRSPTPTNGNPNGATSAYSPTSPVFPDAVSSTPHLANGSSPNGLFSSPNRRSSKQAAQHHHHHSSSLASANAHALLLSPLANSSRSSLESAGSSYHSWDEEHRKDRLVGLFSHLDPERGEWHEIACDRDKSSESASGSGTSPARGGAELGAQEEEIVKRHIGLSKADFVAIQDKLVGAAVTKAATPEGGGRHRASSLRRRRPSTSQSNYSFNGGDPRGASPAPQLQNQNQAQPQLTSSTPRPTNSDHLAKANALLDSVVDSIQSPRAKGAEAISSEEAAPVFVQSPTDPQISSPTQRHRALAEALFGAEDHDRSLTPSQSAPAPVAASSSSQTSEQVYSDPTDVSTESGTVMRDPSTPTISVQAALPPSSPHMVNTTLLALDVQRRAEAATAALRKSPSIPKLGDTNATVVRKRINPSQISSPKLVSASTSVDTIPLRSPSAASGAVPQKDGSSKKLTSRFKKLRGTLRTKAPPRGDEVTPYPLDLRSPPSSHTVNLSPNIAVHAQPVVSSAKEIERFKVPAPPVPSPPASAGPGLKGFMSRLYRKQRPNDALSPSPADRRGFSPQSATSSSPSVSPTPDRLNVPANPLSPQVHSAPAASGGFNTARPKSPSKPPAVALGASPPSTRENTVVLPSASTDEAALRQLFDAASNLGLDQAALNDLIARSPSTSSKSTAWTRLTRANSVSDGRNSHRFYTRDSTIPPTPTASEGRPSVDVPTPRRPSTDVRQLNVVKNAEATPRPRQPKSDNANNAVVRRTIIYPSDSRTSTFDLNTLMRKSSTSRRRRSAGAGSLHSNRSIQDRVPTPPPPRSTGGGRRFSTDTSPPVPHLPPSFASNVDNTLVVPGQMEKSSSTYDSLYEMYAGDSRTPTALGFEAPGAGGEQPAHMENGHEPGPALQVIELANGETIWSIVNGLRDDDESFYGDRTSFTSEYSMKDPGETVKIAFKEHGRKSSKGSNHSFLSRKKQPQASSSRPETKVFFSSSAQIGRLIENLSRGMEAGSFNITPDRAQGHVGHSASSSLGSEADMRWTVEERLEQMLGSMTTTP